MASVASSPHSSASSSSTSSSTTCWEPDQRQPATLACPVPRRPCRRRPPRDWRAGPGQARSSGMRPMDRAALRIYMGYAAGVGKTFAMLAEGRRQHELGVDVVVGFVEPHGRAPVLEGLAGLEVVPLRRVAYHGRLFPEMDVDAILARQPRVALVDELAHSNVPGSRNRFRWQDVAELLDAGITVLSTLNVQHLEQRNDVVERTPRT